jgi:hypothetical protein
MVPLRTLHHLLRLHMQVRILSKRQKIKGRPMMKNKTFIKNVDIVHIYLLGSTRPRRACSQKQPTLILFRPIPMTLTKKEAADSEKLSLLAQASKLAVTYIQPYVNDLESLSPVPLEGKNIFFLAIDECSSVSDVLPIIRRLWREAKPQRTWILFVDTNSDVAALSGTTARLASNRLNVESGVRLAPPYVNLPLDVAFKEEIKKIGAKLWSQQITFAELSGTLSKLGRALWQTTLYRDDRNKKLPKPDFNSILIKLLGGVADCDSCLAYKR